MATMLASLSAATQTISATPTPKMIAATGAQDKPTVVVLKGCDMDQAVSFAHQSLRPEAATTRILVEERIRQVFVESLLDSIEATSQDPQQQQQQQRSWPEISPDAASGQNLQRVRELARSAKAEGATIRTGVVPSGSDIISGYAFSKNPTVVDGVRPDMKIFLESVTGPIATVSGFSQAEEAVGWLNDTFVGGGGARVFARDADAARGFVLGVRSGPVLVNGDSEPRQQPG